MSGSETMAELRGRLERVDAQILVLAAERIRLGRAVGEAKRRDGLPTVDCAQERAVLERGGRRSEKGSTRGGRGAARSEGESEELWTHDRNVETLRTYGGSGKPERRAVRRCPLSALTLASGHSSAHSWLPSRSPRPCPLARLRPSRAA
jgi:hypothetical protein